MKINTFPPCATKFSASISSILRFSSSLSLSLSLSEFMYLHTSPLIDISAHFYTPFSWRRFVTHSRCQLIESPQQTSEHVEAVFRSVDGIKFVWNKDKISSFSFVFEVDSGIELKFCFQLRCSREGARVLTMNLLHEVVNEMLDENCQLERLKAALGVRAGTVASVGAIVRVGNILTSSVS